MSERDVSAGDGAGPLRTPDGRYIVVRGRLWRAADPNLPEHERQRLVARLMDARRRLRLNLGKAERAAVRAEVHAAKVALGERGPVWWSDGDRDLHRTMVANSPYAAWFAEICGRSEGLL